MRDPLHTRVRALRVPGERPPIRAGHLMPAPDIQSPTDPLSRTPDPGKTPDPGLHEAFPSNRACLRPRR